MSSSKVEFAGTRGNRLAGVMELPDQAAPRAFAVFAHCFACGKNSLAATKISRALASRGIATLRFDFTGLGDSEGELGQAGITANVEDLVAACRHAENLDRALRIQRRQTRLDVHGLP